MTISLDGNEKFNHFVSDISQPLKALMLPLLSGKELAMLQASCKIFQKIVTEDLKSMEKLAYHRRWNPVIEWMRETSIPIDKPSFITDETVNAFEMWPRLGSVSKLPIAFIEDL